MHAAYFMEYMYIKDKIFWQENWPFNERHLLVDFLGGLLLKKTKILLDAGTDPSRVGTLALLHPP
jgi:hypothetical protein